MHPKAQKLRQDAKAIWTALKAIIDASPNGILTDAQNTEISAKRAEADAMIKSAESIEAVEVGVSALDRPLSRNTVVDAGDIAIDAEDADPIGRVRKIGGTLIPKAVARKFGLFAIAQLARSNVSEARSLVNERTIQQIRDTFGSDLNALHIEGSNIPGGNLVIPEWDSMMITLRETFGSFRRNVRMVQMGSEVRNIFRRVAGLQAYLVGEAKSITSSTKKWDRVILQAKKVGALTASSKELNDDSAIDLGADLMSELAYALALSEDNAGWNGDGTTGAATEYLGMIGVRYKLRSLISGTISKIYGLTLGSGSGQTTNYSGLALADFNAVVANLPAYADSPNCKWYCHRSFYYGVMQKLALAAGGVTATEVMNGVRQRLFLGYPVEFVQAFPKTAAASQICALFGDLTLAAKMGERRGIDFAMSLDATVSDGGTSYPLWQNDMIGWKCTERIDINVHDVGTSSDIVATPSIDIPGAGPIVGLITAAS